ncbi:hypothetical protein XBKQ1_410004 [Xenorhabdus bovienii str. kraussei Quebec]|uniref:Uncharacterized protein n=1 Tax=Xenorhabdus bovienii str. kraussei Quebec TaxID=1398203 RepID=A0A077PAF5_XENBV|nr:hypothetical protein XBKQ1_410004 [Xenorhabdus bovienii str. kraussei Quebec]
MANLFEAVTLIQRLGKSQWLLYVLDKRNKCIAFQRIVWT